MNIAIVFAGGIGVRMKSTATPKQFLDFQGKPLIIHVLEKFEFHEDIDIIVVACLPSWILRLKQMIGNYGLSKIKFVVEGGLTTQGSVFNAMKIIDDNYGRDHIVLVHDGVRPIFSKDSIYECLNKAKQYGAAVTAIPATETIVKASDSDFIEKAFDRSMLYLAQAPQAFDFNKLFSCHLKSFENGSEFIDSCSMYLHYYERVAIVDGIRGNIKVTVPEDYFVIKGVKEFYDVREIEGY